MYSVFWVDYYSKTPLFAFYQIWSKRSDCKLDLNQYFSYYKLYSCRVFAPSWHYLCKCHQYRLFGIKITCNWRLWLKQERSLWGSEWVNTIFFTTNEFCRFAMAKENGETLPTTETNNLKLQIQRLTLMILRFKMAISNVHVMLDRMWRHSNKNDE